MVVRTDPCAKEGVSHDHRAAELKSSLLRSLAAASDLEQEQEDGSQEARPKSADGAWMKKYNSSQARESGQGHHRPANAFTVVFPRRKSGQSCRMISRECPLLPVLGLRAHVGTHPPGDAVTVAVEFGA